MLLLLSMQGEEMCSETKHLLTFVVYILCELVHKPLCYSFSLFLIWFYIFEI